MPREMVAMPQEIAAKTLGESRTDNGWRLKILSVIAVAMAASKSFPKRPACPKRQEHCCTDRYLWEDNSGSYKHGMFSREQMCRKNRFPAPESDIFCQRWANFVSNELQAQICFRPNRNRGTRRKAKDREGEETGFPATWIWQHLPFTL